MCYIYMQPVDVILVDGICTYMIFLLPVHVSYMKEKKCI